MPLSSLENMSIAYDKTNTALAMPKLQYKFRVRATNWALGGSSLEDLTENVVDVSRPTVSHAVIPVDVYNSVIKLAGKAAWESITLTLRDDISNEVSKNVGKQLMAQNDYYNQSSPRAGSDYKFKLEIDILDGGNGDTTTGVLETWILLGCFIENAAYNQLSYGASEVVTISLTISFDNALQAYDGATEPSSTASSTWYTYGITAGSGELATSKAPASPPIPPLAEPPPTTPTLPG